MLLVCSNYNEVMINETCVTPCDFQIECSHDSPVMGLGDIFAENYSPQLSSQLESKGAVFKESKDSISWLEVDWLAPKNHSLTFSECFKR